MNKIWTFLFCISIILIIIVNPDKMLVACLDSVQSCIKLCFNLFCAYVIWLSIIEMAERSGLNKKIAHLFLPLTKKLFRTQNEESAKYISLNVSANLLGIGNAATPSGISAMKSLDDGSGKINFPMMMLFIINACSIQLLPTTIVALRCASGSDNPSSIILPNLLTTFCSVTIGVTLVFIIDKISRILLKKRKKSE